MLLAKHFRHFAFDDALGQALGDGGLADAGIAYIERVVFRPPAQDLDGALDFRFAPDQRIDFSGRRLLVQVHAIGAQRILVAPAGFFLALVIAVGRRAGALRRALRGAAGCLGNAMADEVHRIESRHVLQLQEIHGMAFPLGEQRDEHVRAGHFIAAGALHVNRRALHDALEAGRRFRLGGAVRGQAGQILVEEFREFLAQLVQIDAACPQHGRGIAVVGKRQ